MQKTILTCDRCKKEVDKLYEVGAGARSEYSGQYHPGGREYRVYQLLAEWCLKCCIEMHIVQPVKGSDAKPLATPPTLEDMIREIVREEISERE
jgi:hypothetical protein